MAENKEEILIRLKFGLTLTKLLELVKKQKEKEQNEGNNKSSLNASLGKISIDSGLRVATLSDIFSGKSNPKAVTICLILSALGKTMSDFGRVYDKISESEVLEYKDHIKVMKKFNKKNTTKVKK